MGEYTGCFLYNCSLFDLFLLVLVTYDVFLTMDREVNFIWKRGLRFGTIIYILARYATPLSMMVEIMFTFLPPNPITGLIQVSVRTF